MNAKELPTVIRMRIIEYSPRDPPIYLRYFLHWWSHPVDGLRYFFLVCMGFQLGFRYYGDAHHMEWEDIRAHKKGSIVMETDRRMMFTRLLAHLLETRRHSPIGSNLGLFLDRTSFRDSIYARPELRLVSEMLVTRDDVEEFRREIPFYEELMRED